MRQPENTARQRADLDRFRAVHVELAAKFEERVVRQVRNRAAVGGVDVEFLAEVAPHAFDDIGGVVAASFLEKFFDRILAVGQPFGRGPGFRHFIRPVITVERNDRLGRGRRHAVALEERHIFLGVADSGRISAVHIHEFQCVIRIQPRFGFGARLGFVFLAGLLGHMLAELRQIVPPIVIQAEQPGTMVDPGDSEVEFGVHFRRNGLRIHRQQADPLHEQGADIRLMVAVAKREAFDVRGQTHQSDAQHRSRVDEVDQPGIGGQAAHVVNHPERFGQFAHGAENAAGPDGVAGTHGHAVFQADPGVDAAVISIAERKRKHHEVRILHDLPTVGRADDFQFASGVFPGAAGELHHGIEHGRVGVDQRQCAAAQHFTVNHVVNYRFAEKITSGADHYDFRSFFHLTVSRYGLMGSDELIIFYHLRLEFAMVKMYYN